MQPTFCTAINCIDGRTQLPLIDWLSRSFKVEHVDLVTEAGVVKFLALDPESTEAASVYRRVDVSVGAHASQGLAIVAHHDCAGNPVPKEEQLSQLKICLENLAARFPQMEILALWVDEGWRVHEIERRSPSSPS